LRTLMTLALTLAISALAPSVGWAAPQQANPPVDLFVVGDVSVDGTPASSGAIAFSNGTVTTGKDSSAVVTLKFGRVELLPNSSLRLTVTDMSISGMLAAGRVHVSSASGVAAMIATRDGAAVADVNQANVFLVDVECGNTIVSTQSGRVELRAGNSVKQITEGGQDTAGKAKSRTCTRPSGPGSDEPPTVKILSARFAGATLLLRMRVCDESRTLRIAVITSKRGVSAKPHRFTLTPPTDCTTLTRSWHTAALSSHGRYTVTIFATNRFGWTSEPATRTLAR
jgi:hypothetical protein